MILMLQTVIAPVGQAMSMLMPLVRKGCVGDLAKKEFSRPRARAFLHILTARLSWWGFERQSLSPSATCPEPFHTLLALLGDVSPCLGIGVSIVLTFYLCSGLPQSIGWRPLEEIFMSPALSLEEGLGSALLF